MLRFLFFGSFGDPISLLGDRISEERFYERNLSDTLQYPQRL